MNDALWNTFTIKMCKFFNQMVIIKKGTPWFVVKFL
ncbi:hypothetical protein CGLO_11175 [Colletotrichum gloeosporioides Cg-14]|uniref:Uncharacterized protein n=1 Tax=Colletotrichum gloeosporioides (strain Cg-14) TaxID=1237896 RepID=T0K8W4_COLGC|nr:hypothetical protein CGLO_11175 [Colletotrichum gloeosporioides Cg-14]